MTTNCPQCGNSLDQDFGVVTCPECQAVLFIDMDGNASMAVDNSPTPMMGDPTAGQEQGLELEPVQLSNPEFISGAEPEVEVEPQQNQWDLDPVVENGDEVVSLEALNEPLVPDLTEPIDEPSVQESSGTGVLDESSEPESGARGLSEVADYANSDQAFGPLTYSVTIEQIDTKEIRLQVFEALSDPKFAWDAKDLLKQVKAGCLKIENLNPVKASVLVHKLQDLSVKVSWTQNVYSS